MNEDLDLHTRAGVKELLKRQTAQRKAAEARNSGYLYTKTSANKYTVGTPVQIDGPYDKYGIVVAVERTQDFRYKYTIRGNGKTKIKNTVYHYDTM